MATLFDPFDPLTGDRKYQSDHVVNSDQFYRAPVNNPLSQNDTSRNRELHYAFLEETNKDSSLQSRISSALKAAKINASPIKLFEAINGFTISISPAEAERLKAIPTIRSIEADRPLPLTPPVEVTPETNNSAAESSFFSEKYSAQGWREIDRAVSLDQYYVNTKTSASREEESSTNGASAAALPIYNNGSASTGEILPYGVKAVWGGSDISTKGNAGSGTYAFVIDSGVLDTTGDLNVNKTWSKSWVSGETAFTDGNGHGTHVAGTIAALANGVGVVGVAPAAEVISLKVFNSAGGGASYSTIIDAVNYATQVINDNGLDKSKVVINMSLGGSYSEGMDAAVKNAANQGIKFSIAAGNSGADADGYSPASAGDHANIYTVSAVDNQYQMAYFSNWDDQSGGDDVDVAAPGVSVLSYYKGGQLAKLSGTSMAAPHVAGLLLMGGVKEGDMVTANWAGEADPFALASNGQPPTPPAPIKPPTEGLIDDFSGGQTASFWKSISLGTVNNNFTGRSESLFFTGSGARSATTKAINLDQGAIINFDLVYGNDFNGGEQVDPGEEVLLEYSNNGSSWTVLKSFDIDSSTFSWGAQTASLSAALTTESSQLRWRQKSHSDSNWDEWGIDNISIKDTSQLKYSEVEGKYVYGNGDYFFFSGTITNQYGGGSFSVGQKIYATDNSKDAFDQAVNETGNQGYYLITSASNKIGVATDAVKIGDYYDSETRATVIPYQASTGTKGLGSESAFLTSRKSQTDDLISNYHEADHPSYSEIGGKYIYGNGDYYFFSGTITNQYGGGAFSVGQKIYATDNSKDSFDQAVNETGNQGYYLITSANNKTGAATDSVKIDDYYDSETRAIAIPYQASTGTKGLGSESAFLTSRKSQTDDLISNYHEADHPSYYWEVSGKYFYGDGDYYSFSGFINDEHTDGSLFSGAKVYSDSDSKDAFSSSINETGFRGYYQLDTSLKKFGSVAKGIAIDSYFDSESLFNIRPYTFQEGHKGLGSESGFITEIIDIKKDYFDSSIAANIHIYFEDIGNAKIITDSSNIVHISGTKGKIFKLQRNGWGDGVTQDRGGWKIAGAETINGTNYVLDHSEDRVYVWEMDDNWNFLRDAQTATPTEAAYYQIESNFGLDLNNDGLTGTPKLSSIENQGSTELLVDATGKAWVDSSAGSFRLNRNGWGDGVTQDRGGWKIAGAETINGTNYVLDHSEDRVYVWEMDDNWNFLRDAQTATPTEAAYYQIESNFGLDLNNDGLTGTPKLSSIENQGSTELLVDATGKAWVDSSAGSFRLNRNGWGDGVTQDRGGWKIAGAETINGTNYVLDHSEDRVYVWEMDDNWNFLRDAQTATPTEAAYYQIESNFGLDLNNDGLTGTPKLSSIENQGSTELLVDATGKAWVDSSAGSFRLNRNGWGDGVTQDRGGWKIAGAETINGTNYVLDHSEDRVYVWEMDDNWNFLRDAQTATPTEAAYYQIESNFGLDLNNDGLTGTPKLSSIENQGSTELLVDATGKAWVDSSAGSFRLNRNGWGDGVTQDRGGWKIAGAETINGTNYVLDHSEDRVYVWEMDDNWNFLRDAQTATPTEAAYYQIESNFGLDLNNDGLSFQ